MKANWSELSRRLTVVLSCCLFASSLAGEGIPVHSELVRTACGSCHASDEQGRMSRISYLRKSPEGWQLTLKRMIRTGNVTLTPEQARAVVRYLSDEHGLAPEEARPFFYRAERRPTLETEEDQEIETTCLRCHLGARYATQRRSAEEWMLLKGMHIGYFPVVESQTFRAGGEEDPEGVAREDAESKDWRVDRVLRKLAKRYPLDGPEWRAFQARKTKPNVEGRWLLTAQIPGVGELSGELDLVSSEAGYRYSASLLHPDGSSNERVGEGILYGGYSWRGRSSGAGLGELREVLMLSDDGSTMAGRGFHGAFGELGVAIRLDRLGDDPRVATMVPPSVRAGASQQRVVVSGANLPADIEAADVSLGHGVTVSSVEVVDAKQWRLLLDVDPAALPGYRDLGFRSFKATQAFAVYDRMDYVKVLPEESMARVGGQGAPKQFAQFEAIAFQRGPDNESFTADDVRVGVVPARWSLEEYHGRREDDDVQHVGAIDAKGLFTPAIDGPNFDRALNADNMGDVWVVASFQPDGAMRPIRGRSRLVVTIPVYVFWDLFP